MENDKINQIKSVYPLDDFTERLLKASEEGKLIITPKNKAQEIFASIGVQPSELSKILELSNNSLSENNDSVNNNSTQTDKKYSLKAKRQ